jgi:hypothetical protein
VAGYRPEHTLASRARCPARAEHQRDHQVLALGEILHLRKRLSNELRREVGLYPETKHSSYFRSIGLELEPKLIDALNRAGLTRRGAPVSEGPDRAARCRGILRAADLTDTMRTPLA